MIVSILICLVFISGVILLESNTIMILVWRYRLRHRLSKKPEEGKLSAFCSSVISAAFGRWVDGIWLIVLEISLFFAGFIVAFTKLSFLMSFVMGVLTASLPPAFLFVRINSVRSKGSKEAVSVITELHRQYRICGLNIFEAIEKTIESGGEYPVCKKQLYLLLLKLRESSGNKDIKEACKRFSFSLGTVWAKMLSNSIEIATCSGTDISLALSDLINQLKEAQSRFEAKKRMNNEAVRMTVFLVPIMYVGTIFASVKYLDFSAGHFIRNQFFTSEGIIFFLITLFMFFINLLILNMVNNERTDL